MSLLDSEFWQPFIDHHWERIPTVLKSSLEEPVLNWEELFDGLMAATASFCASRNVQYRSSHIRLSRRHAAIITDVQDYLPTGGDGSVMAYAHRLDGLVNGEPFELIVNEFQEHSLPLWSRLCRFLGGLYRLVGLPARRAEVAIFLRNHEKTSFGVHRDDASVFLFPLHGQKRILAWPPDVFESTNVTATLDYECFRDAAIVLEGQPGDVLYWPSSHWHVGEAESGTTISANLGLHIVADPEAELWSAMRLIGSGNGPRATETIPVQGYPDNLETAPNLPSGWADLLRSLQQASLDGSLERSLRLVWANRVTGQGFLSCPPPERPVPPANDAVVRAVTPILWMPWGDDKIACSANGRSFSVTATRGVLRMLEQLSTGPPFVVCRLLEDCSREGPEETAFLRAVIARLLALRALVSQVAGIETT